MGLNICRTSTIQTQYGQLDPILTTFSPIDYQPQIDREHQTLLAKIKKRLVVIDCRQSNDLSWYQSPKYNLYLYGIVKRDRPFGDCFFYTKDPALPATPLIIATSVSQHYVYSSNTLIIYPDCTVYYGAIKNNIAALPRAQGRGKLITNQFVYEGEFKNGYPHGYGNYRSRTFEFVGQFVNGSAIGGGIAKSAQELFIGEIVEGGQRNGVKISKKNQVIKVKQQEFGRESEIQLRSHLREK